MLLEFLHSSQKGLIMSNSYYQLESEKFVDGFFRLLDEHEADPTSYHSVYLRHPFVLIISANGSLDLVNSEINRTISHSRNLKKSDPRWISYVGKMLAKYLERLSD